MILKQCVLVLLLLSAGVCAHAQERDVYDINLTFNDVKAAYDVNVNIERRGNDVRVLVKSSSMVFEDSQWTEKIKGDTFPLSLSKFDSIVAVAKAINCADIMRNVGSAGYDGTICTIEIGGFENGITYKVWSPNYETKERQLVPFLNAFKLILTTGKLNADKLFE